MDPSRHLPAELVAQARAYVEGEKQPVEPKKAATIVLLRRGAAPEPGALEVYLLRRHTTMAFASGMAVFPGGGVDPRDFDQEIAWVGPSAAEWARHIGVDDEALAGALVCAAVRETFEESGVLFAGPSPDTVVADTTGADWEEDRRRLEARELSFTDFLQQRNLKLRTDLLRVWGSWVTPVFEPRRFRAWFFVAELPEGQLTRDVSTESQEVTWMSVREAITAVDAQQLAMMPPQYCTCLELFDCLTPTDALRAAELRDQVPVAPAPRLEGEDPYLELPQRLVTLGEEIGRRLAR